MTDPPRSAHTAALDTAGPPNLRGGLLRKYLATMMAVVAIPLLAVVGVILRSSYLEQQQAVLRTQRLMAEAAANRIDRFISDITGNLNIMAQHGGLLDTVEQRRNEMRLLLRHTPAITEVAEITKDGREALRISRIAPDITASNADRSKEPVVISALRRKVYYGPVTFKSASEPYMTIALPRLRAEDPLFVAEVNLKFIWDVVSRIKIGEKGWAYVVDRDGRVIAHPDISLVLRDTSFEALPQVRAALHSGPDDETIPAVGMHDPKGQTVVAAQATIAPLGWHVLAEVPASEAYAPVYASQRTAVVILLGGLALAALASLMLARRLVAPVLAVQNSVSRIGAGALDQRIDIATGDELEALGREFNGMATKLQSSYSTLEEKVATRTHELLLANQAKSRFLAVASHDLRQPLHALGLFVAQLKEAHDLAVRDGVVSRIDAAVTTMNEQFDSLMDLSKLDAAVIKINMTAFPVERLFNRIETTFDEAAYRKGLSMRVAQSTAWIRSDPVLLERVLLNLASNAVRYTDRGGVIVGARQRGEMVHLEVWDSGPGIPENQRHGIFAEFYQLASSPREPGRGLGLGLAIVERLCNLLGHKLVLTSLVGSGSRFTIIVPAAAADADRAVAAPRIGFPDHLRGKLIVVVDDDALVLEGMRGLLTTWGCHVISGGTADAVVREIVDGQLPDLLISDYRLANGHSGVDAIAKIRRHCERAIPAFLISGDTAPERLREATEAGFHLLHKPVQPMVLRTLINRLLPRASRDESISLAEAGVLNPIPRP